MREWDVIVVGGGHAGVEAAAAAARTGARVLLVTLRSGDPGALSCNPAIGGVGKGQLVKEVDALGGVMGRAADRACIQVRRLNTNRGAAVQSTRMQVDMDAYRQAVQAALHALPGLTVAEDEALGLRIAHGRVAGVRLASRGDLSARSVVLTPGTFFRGVIHVGREQTQGGRWGETGVSALPETLQDLGLRFGRFKTGTTPRLDGRTLDFSRMQIQPGDAVFTPFSFTSAERPVLDQTSCYLTHTTETTHQLIRDHLQDSALYSGRITATGVRYCPSVEDKIVKFPDRDSHHVFVEPERLDLRRWYPNGLSNSLPPEIQIEVVRSVPGLERADIVQVGYGIEHDYLDPTQLRATLETKLLPGLFLAGQINGTTGYEEAAAQGLLAGLNAARSARADEPVILTRDQAYLGVLIDDLVTKGTLEPYRMFTSRVEYRLVIREDNADERLTPLGRAWGLVSDEDYDAFQGRMDDLAKEEARIRTRRLTRPGPDGEVTATWESWLKRPELGYAELAPLDPEIGDVPRWLRERIEIRCKYAGYIRRQDAEIERFRASDQVRIPDGFVYQGLPGLSLEVVEKLTRLQPRTVGQAARISGITPAAITLLLWKLEHPVRKPAA